MLTALGDGWPVNIALLGKGEHGLRRGNVDSCRGGAAGFKLHEDWGSTPAAIDACLRVCDAAGAQAALHTDTLNEGGLCRVHRSPPWRAGQSTQYHPKGAGGGHRPGHNYRAALANFLPSSDHPTRPHTVNTIDEHLDMLMVCHHLNPAVPEDLAFAESRIRPSTIAPEDLLHDIGAISDDR